jgi:hypothetical protein
VLDSHTTVTDNFNPQQLKVKDMEDFEQQAIIRAVDALETIAEHMGVLASMALANMQAAPAGEQPKRPRGRPRKDTTVHMVGVQVTDAVGAQAEAPAPAVQPPALAVSEAAEPTKEEMAKAQNELRQAIKSFFALHGQDAEAEARAKAVLGFPMVSAVPYSEIPAVIKRFEAI